MCTQPFCANTDDPFSPTYSAARKKEEALARLGATLGVMSDMFRDIQDIIIAGLEWNTHTPVSAMGYRCALTHPTVYHPRNKFKPQQRS